jgi:hypothetical protein
LTVKPNKLTLLVQFMIAYVLVILLLYASVSIFESRLDFLKGLLALRDTFGGSRHVHLSVWIIAIIWMLTINRQEQRDACRGACLVVIAELRTSQPLVPVVLMV